MKYKYSFLRLGYIIFLISLICFITCKSASEQNFFPANEKIGPLYLSMNHFRLLSILGNPSQKTVDTYEPATGLTISTWTYLKKGIIIRMSKVKAGYEIDAITIRKPCLFKTVKGIGVNSTEEEVRKAYPDYPFNNGITYSNKGIALNINFKSKKIKYIYLGPVPE